MTYRLIRKSNRNDTTGGIDHRYYVEVYSKNIFGKWKWYPYQVYCCGFGDCYWQTIYFYDEKKAIKYIQNLTVEIPKDKLICQNSL